MNFQQLKIIREAARCHFNLTEVANTLYTSQSGVSRHIKELEDELGVELFIRRGKRLLGMTEPGKALLTMAERILTEANNIRRLADNFANSDRGRLHVLPLILRRVTRYRASSKSSARNIRKYNWCCIRAARVKLSLCCSMVKRILVSPVN